MRNDTKNVPGADAMARRKAHVRFAYIETPLGGRVDITTTDRDALAGVHAFLAFQIKDHKTGDETESTKRPKG